MTTAVGTSESAERSMLRRNAPAFFILGILWDLPEVHIRAE